MMTKPTIDRISRLALVTHDLDAAIAMFETFDAMLVMRRELPATYAQLLGVPGSTITEAMLRLGDQDISLLAFDPPGRPYPANSTSTDLWFQHFAIIVSDMNAAYAKLEAYGRFQPISTDGPEQLPPSSGSVMAFKFRDSEGHPLEFLCFPKGKGPACWEAKRASGLFLGIDHSAVAVGDTSRSTTFLEQAFGLTLGSRTENTGPEQSRMDGLIDARVAVTGMMPAEAPPHVELLGYQMGERRPIDEATEAHDLTATFFVLQTRDLAGIVDALEAIAARFVSPGIVAIEENAQAIMVLDPDGHRLCVVQIG